MTTIHFDRQTKAVLLLMLAAVNVLLVVAFAVVLTSHQTIVVPVQVIAPPSATPVPGQAIVIPTLPPAWTPTFTPLPTETSIAPTPTLEVSPTKVIKKTGPTATRRPSATAGPGVATPTADVCVVFPSLCGTDVPEGEITNTPAPQPTTDTCQREWLSTQYVPYMQNMRDYYQVSFSANQAWYQGGGWSESDKAPWKSAFELALTKFSNVQHPACVDTQAALFHSGQQQMLAAIDQFGALAVRDTVKAAFADMDAAIQQVQTIAGQ